MAKQHKMPKHFAGTGAPTEAVDPTAKKVSLLHLAIQATPEFIAFQGLATLVVAFVIFLLQKVSSLLIRSGGVAITSSNISSILTSWQGILLVIIGLAIIVISVSVDIFATIFFCDGVLKGDQRMVLKRTGESINRALAALPRFLTLGGIFVLIYIAFLAPLVGVGFSTFLTAHIYIPSYIMDVVNNTPLYKALYVIVMSLLALFGIVYAFSLHAILLDDMRPMAAYKRSRVIIKQHWKDLVKGLLTMLVAILICSLVVIALFIAICYALTKLGNTLPAHYMLDSAAVLRGEIQLGELDYKVLGYRTLCIFVFFIVAYVLSFLTLLLASFTTLVLTHLYAQCKNDAADKMAYYPSRNSKHHGWLKLFEVVGMSLILGAVSLSIALRFDQVLMRPEPAKIIAHRLGGALAPENSVEGLELAISMHCYGAETDIQRTTDGYYVINHDETFERLAGVGKAPTDMTLEQVKNLRLVDQNYPDKTYDVATLDELLDVSMGHIKLFIELKGTSADAQMVDDVVKMVRERDALDDVVLISSEQDVIRYAETTYPEFETGLLSFTEFGDLSLLQCDMLLLEEETATDEHLRQAQEIGRQTGIWTVNTRLSMGKVLNSRADYIITDRMDLAEEVQKSLDNRNDLQIIIDWVSRFVS